VTIADNDGLLLYRVHRIRSLLIHHLSFPSESVRSVLFYGLFGYRESFIERKCDVGNTQARNQWTTCTEAGSIVRFRRTRSVDLLENLQLPCMAVSQSRSYRPPWVNGHETKKQRQ